MYIFRNEIYKCIFANKEIDYKGLYLLLPSLDEDDIEYATDSRDKVTIKKSAFSDFQRSCYLDLIFLDEVSSRTPWKVPARRYKMTSQTEVAINLRFEKII